MVLCALAGCGQERVTAPPPSDEDAGLSEDAGPLDPDAGPDAGDAGPAEDAGPPMIWPNALAPATSSPWIAANHDAITEMRPRFLVVNFANGIGLGGNDNTSGGPVTAAQVRAKAEAFLAMLRRASIYQERLNPGAQPFLRPEIAKVVDLQDTNGHANGNLFPRGPADPSTGYHTVGYYQLFSAAYAPHWGYFADGHYLTLGELVERGLVHEVILSANQVDGRSPNPADQVTANILEVAMVAKAYDAAFVARQDEFVKNGIAFARQKLDMAAATFADHNSMPWIGRSLRIYFLNISRGAGCLMHSLGHEFEFRYNESRIYAPSASYHGATPNPYLQPLFRQFADFDMRGRYGVNFDSLYSGGDAYTYSGCTSNLCTMLNYPLGQIPNYRPRCGNAHYPPGATHGYDYQPAQGVMSECESFLKPGGAAAAFTRANYAALTADAAIDKDCGGEFLVYWMQNMPGFGNGFTKSWWPFMYY